MDPNFNQSGSADPPATAAPLPVDVLGAVGAAEADALKQRAEERPRTSLTRTVLRLATGRGAIVAGGLVTTPILTRLYGPESFGTLALLTTLIAILAPLTSLCYSSAMPVAPTVSQRRALLILSFMIGAVGTVLLAVVALLAGKFLANAFRKPELAGYAICIPLLFLAYAVITPIDMALRCQKEFGKVLTREAITNSGTRILQIALGFLGFAGSVEGLLLGLLGGTFGGAAFLCRSAVKPVLTGGEQPFRMADLKSVAVQFKSFPLFQFGSQTLNSVTAGLPVFVMGLLFPMQVVGIYSVVVRILFLPTQLFSGSASDVFYVEAAECIHRGESAAAPTSELFRLLATLTAFPFSVTLVLGPLLFEIVLGPSWREAGVFAQILFPWVAITAVGTTMSAMLMVRDRLGENLTYNVVLVALRLAALVAGGMWFGPRTALALFAAVSVLVYGHIIMRTLELAYVSRRWAARVLAKAYAEAILLLLPAGLCDWWWDSHVWALVALGAACAAHVAILNWRHPALRTELARYVPRRGPFNRDRL